MLAQERLGGLATVAELVLAIGKPGPHLFTDAALDGHIQNRALFGDAGAVHDVKLGRTERSRHLVLNDLGTNAIADNLVLELDGIDFANIDSHGREELERAASRGGLGVAEHDADLLAQLVNEDAGRVGLGKRAGELAECLAHQASLQTHRRVTDLALDLGTWSQGGNRVDDDGVDGT